MAPISFARGVPAPECLAVDDLADCARAALERDGHTILSYGPRPATRRCGTGSPRATASTRRASSSRTARCRASCSWRSASPPGKRVLVERPTYDRPLKILRELGADVVALDCDDEGLDPDALEAALASGEKPAFLYLIPTFQNPSGRTLSEERRRRIVELAREHDLLVLEDDPYGLVRYEGEACRRSSTSRTARSIYSSSFSKTIAPGLRVGWFVFPEPLARRDRGDGDSTYITPVLLGQATVHEFVSRGLFEPNLERVRGPAAGAARRDARRARPRAARRAHDAARGRLLPLARARRRRRRRVAAAGGGGRRHVRARAPTSAATPDTLRLAFSFVSPDEIAEGVSRLASA